MRPPSIKQSARRARRRWPTSPGCRCTASGWSTSDSPVFVRDSREDATFAGNEDEVEFGLHNYLGLPVHDGSGGWWARCACSRRHAREYTEEELAQLSALAGEVEGIIDSDGSALG